MDTDDSLTPGEENLIDTGVRSRIVLIATKLGAIRRARGFDV